MFINAIPLTHTHISHNVFLKQRYNSPLIRKLDINYTDHSTDNEKFKNAPFHCVTLKSISDELSVYSRTAIQ